MSNTFNVSTTATRASISNMHPSLANIYRSLKMVTGIKIPTIASSGALRFTTCLALSKMGASCEVLRCDTISLESTSISQLDGAHTFHFINYARRACLVFAYRRYPTEPYATTFSHPALHPHPHPPNPPHPTPSPNTLLWHTHTKHATSLG